MKNLNFKQTFINGLLLALPLLAIIYILIKILITLEKIIAPLAERVGIQRLLGELTISIFALVILLFFFFILGVLLHMNLLKDLNKQVENFAYKLVPRLYKIKSLAYEDENKSFSTGWKPIVMQEDDGWIPAYITEESEKWITVFIPDAPDAESGAVKMMDASKMNYKTVDGIKLHSFLHNYGKGMIELTKNNLPAN